ncbi:DUF4232 domain-containing protein [Spelaeicoccus albus]|uniref:DUF4232 domain-containing protein n=1 Tax=Spelaeicoccus albus TaxID=1280376 RepID=A0A7Z0A8V3_9MICO|nr:hypothetical protein [Spelaeicoccus albus]
MLFAPAVIAVIGLTLAGCSNDDSGDNGSSNQASSQSQADSTPNSSKDSSGADKGSARKSTKSDSQSDKSGTKSDGSKRDGSKSDNQSEGGNSDTKSGSKNNDKSGSKSDSQAKGSSVARCRSSHLAASVRHEPGGDSAGHTGIYVVVKNTGQSPCLMKGYGGLSFVGHSNGTQLGAPADRTKTRVPSVVVIPNGHARAPVQISNPGNYGAKCHQTTADGFRFYPPNETHSMFIKKSIKACDNSKVHLLQMRPFEPMS